MYKFARWGIDKRTFDTAISHFHFYGSIILLLIAASGIIGLVNMFAEIDNATDCSIANNPGICFLKEELTWRGLQILPYFLIAYAITQTLVYGILLKKTKEQEVAK